MNEHVDNALGCLFIVVLIVVFCILWVNGFAFSSGLSS